MDWNKAREKIKKDLSADLQSKVGEYQFGKILLFFSWPIVTAFFIFLHIKFEGMNWSLFWWGIFFTFVTIFTIGVGYHRLFTHRAFISSQPLTLFLLLWAPASRQYSALKWVNYHRVHHRHTDQVERDPYPITRGLFYAHVGWVLKSDAKAQRQFVVADLLKDKWLVLQHIYYKKLAFLHLFLFPIPFGYYYDSYLGSFAFLGFMKVFVSQNSTFSVNSFCHYFGKKRFNKESSATDNAFLGAYTMGESYHNFHHKFPSDYRAGYFWYTIDPGKWMIYLMSKVGLVGHLKRTPEEAIRKALKAQ